MKPRIVVMNKFTGLYFTGFNGVTSGWASAQLKHAVRFTIRPRLTQILTDPDACGYQIEFIEVDK
jgi:hypothetical protein